MCFSYSDYPGLVERRAHINGIQDIEVHSWCASNLKDVVVLVDKDRVKAGRYAIEKFGCDTLLLDDGFQYWKLRGRRQDIVLIDREQPFGNNGKMLPRGTLREPPSHLSRANIIFITKAERKTNIFVCFLFQNFPLQPDIFC